MSDSPAARRLRFALDMYEFGEQMQRARLHRINPEASEADIDAAVASWLCTRPGAPLGDAPGRPSRRFG
ncbi:MAG: hypothetical protein QOE61_4652 [Micromonosporaceae bacterium]|nr:hypothetical protein [Micromonosporaceae bacterium]